MTITVGVAGITGKFARLVVKNLLAVPNVNIRGFCRNPSKLPEHLQSSQRVTIVSGDASDLELLRSFVQGCDVVICCYLGDNELMTDGQKLLIDACDLENVARYFASDYTFDFTKLKEGQHPAKDPMKHVKAHIETKKNVKGVHVLVGVFMEIFWSGFFGLFDSKECKFSFYGTGDEVFESTTYGTAAEYVAAAAVDLNAVGILSFLGDRKSLRQVAGEFADVYGKEPKVERKGSLDDLSNTMQTTFQRDPSDAFAYLHLFYQYYCTNGQTYLTELDNAKYPSVKPVSFKQFMQSVKCEELGQTYLKLGADV